ncbi:hypothetical protein ACJMK2_017798 [Sinanodonta woodiana]|uniref:VWFC domain-containing protein n=1 Tax=Sinanodonta woodiana TaxID=1069815 RepID=A0ABD3UBE8_SINWO
MILVINKITLIIVQFLVMLVQCLFNGKLYGIGETWHPTVEPFGPQPCVNCTCKAGEKEPSVSCVNELCPKPDCRNPKMTIGKCCPICEDFDNLPPTVTAAEKNETKVQAAGCTFDGIKYRHEERFTSNNTGIRPNSEAQCVLCDCLDGNVLCHLKTCSIPPFCTSFVNRSDDCCLQCADCTWSGGIRRNGSVWHPSITPFGLKECITCTCTNGKIDCEKEECIPDHKLKCKKPRKEAGKCCKTCPKKRSHCKDKKGKDKGKKCPEKHADEDNTDATTKSTNNVCLNTKDEYLVYRHIGRKDGFIAFEDIGKKTVEIFRWKLTRSGKSKVLTSKQETAPSEQFRQQIDNTTILGTTGIKNYRKFKKRLRQKLQSCKDPCKSTQSLKLIKRLKVRELKFGPDCKT